MPALLKGTMRSAMANGLAIRPPHRGRFSRFEGRDPPRRIPVTPPRSDARRGLICCDCIPRKTMLRNRPKLGDCWYEEATSEIFNRLYDVFLESLGLNGWVQRTGAEGGDCGSRFMGQRCAHAHLPGGHLLTSYRQGHDRCSGWGPSRNVLGRVRHSEEMEGRRGKQTVAMKRRSRLLMESSQALRNGPMPFISKPRSSGKASGTPLRPSGV